MVFKKMRIEEVNDLIRKKILEKGSLCDFAKSIGKTKQYIDKIINRTIEGDNPGRVKILVKLGYDKAKEEIKREIFIKSNKKKKTTQ